MLKRSTIVTRRSVLGAAAVMAAPAILRAQPAAPFIIGTGSPGGVYHPLGTGMATVLNHTVPGMAASIAVTGGGVGNLQLLAEGKAAMGLCQVDSALNAFEGDDVFRGKPQPVRALAVLYANRTHLVTTATSGIRTVAGLVGKRVSTGQAGSGTETMAFRVMITAGVNRLKDFSALEQLSPADATKAIIAGKLDAYFFAGGVPTGAITQLGQAPGIQLVLVDQDNLTERLVARYGPVYFTDTISPGSYPGQTAPNLQVSVANILFAGTSMPDAQVTAILTALWTSKPELIAAHSEGKHFTLEAQKTSVAAIPWHPAAEAFWVEQGASLT